MNPYWMVRWRETGEFLVTKVKPHPRLLDSREAAMKTIEKYEVYHPAKYRGQLEPVAVEVRAL